MGSAAQPRHPVAVSRPGQDTQSLDADALAALGPLVGSPLLGTGQINLISLDAVMERLAARWPTRRDMIYDYTLRTLERHIGDDGAFLRVSETDFLITLPHERKFGAQSRCLRYLREVLIYFLGEIRPSDLVVREVTRIGTHGLQAELVDPIAVILAAEREKIRLVETPARAGGLDRWTPFVASDGRAIRVSCVLEPVFELKNYTRIGNRIVRRVLRMDTQEPLTPAELERLSRGDIEKVDLATIARGLERLRTEAADEQQLSLIIPVSYVSLSHRRGRAALAAMLSEAKTFVRTGVICEVRDIEHVPQPALLEATSLIKPFCMFIVGGLNGGAGHGLGNLRGLGLQALSFEAPLGIVGDAEFMGWAKTSIRACRRITKAVMVYRVASARHAGMAALLGASHASLKSAAAIDVA